MVHEGLVAIPISLLPIKVIECVAYPPLSKALWEVAPAFLPNLPISHSLRLGSDTDTGSGGISGGNYFPAFPPTCALLNSVLTEMLELQFVFIMRSFKLWMHGKLFNNIA